MLHLSSSNIALEFKYFVKLTAVLHAQQYAYIHNNAGTPLNANLIDKNEITDDTKSSLEKCPFRWRSTPLLFTLAATTADRR